MLNTIKGRFNHKFGRRFAFWNIPFAPIIPYPLRAAKLSLDIIIFSFWWKPTFTKPNRTEASKANGDTIWWARWMWFQVSYSRWV